MNIYSTVFTAKLESVGKKVVAYFFHFIRIEPQGKIIIRSCKRKMNVFLFSKLDERIANFADKCFQICERKIHLHFPILVFTKVDDLVDEFE